MKQLTIIIILLIILSCNANINQGPYLSKSDINTIKEEIVLYEDIIRNNNLELLTSIFTDNIIFIRPNDSNLNGIDSVLTIHYADVPAVPRFWKSPDEIFGDGKFAYSYGY